MANLLDRIQMQMYRRRKRKDLHQAAINRNGTFESRNNSSKPETETKTPDIEIPVCEKEKPEEKDNKILENQGNIFENIIEKVIPTVGKQAVNHPTAANPVSENQVAEKIAAKPNDDALLAQIDEFRVRAQQLQQLLDSRQERARKLQQIVSEREDKAEELEKIVKERQVRADGLTEAVEKKIDSMASNVDVKLEAVKNAVNAELKDGQAKDETRTLELKETLNQVSEKVDGMSAVTEQLDTVKADLSEKIHTESVQSYRNLSELLKNVEGRLGKLDALEREVAKLRKVTRAIIIFTIINLAGVIVSILAGLGFIGF